jgi:hypothetical protein
MPVAILLGIVSCKKVKENIEQQFIVKIMTDGRWIVGEFIENDSINVTSMFDGYEFQFTQDGKVYSYYDTNQKQGVWEGNTANLTITSNFPGANNPLKKLNDVWKLSNNTTKSVEATPFNSSRVAFLKLAKKK